MSGARRVHKQANLITLLYRGLTEISLTNTHLNTTLQTVSSGQTSTTDVVKVGLSTCVRVAGLHSKEVIMVVVDI